MALCLVPVCALASAQVGRVFHSLEARIGAARSVHVGVIESVSPVEFPIPEGGFFPGKPFLVRFRVSETIKGAPAYTLSLVMTLQWAHELEYFAAHRTELLFTDSTLSNQRTSTQKSLREPGIEYSFRILAPLWPRRGAKDAWVAKQTNVDDDFGQTFDSDLRVLRGRERILNRARAFVKKHGDAVLETVRMQIPNDYARLCGYPNAFAMLTLPKLPVRERLYAGILRDPNRILRHVSPRDRELEGLLLRANMIRSLAEFPSAPNAELIRRVAAPFEPMELQDGRISSLDVRRTADEVLREWGFLPK
jgi:hypothetical protein